MIFIYVLEHIYIYIRPCELIYMAYISYHLHTAMSSAYIYMFILYTEQRIYCLDNIVYIIEYIVYAYLYIPYIYNISLTSEGHYSLFPAIATYKDCYVQ